MLVLPKNTYIIIDPCYVMTDDAYDTLCDKMNFKARAQIVEVENNQIAISTTAFGDGLYESNLNVSFPVDAGIIGAVPLALCCPEKLQNEWVKQSSVIITDSEIEFDYCDGTFKFNDLEIYTNCIDGYEFDEYNDDDEIKFEFDSPFY